MFNSGLRKEAQQNLKSIVDKQKEVADILQIKMKNLYSERNELKEKVNRALSFINNMKNIPEELITQVKETRISLERYQNLLNIADAQYQKDTITSGGVTVGGVAAGVGVAAMAPTAAMAFATTFGTAATGTAISTLSGAAATNAALAWLGGGALVAGGAGVTGGEALLALAGPIGWTIGSVALIGGGIMTNGKNKKAAQKMNEQSEKIKSVSKIQEGISPSIVKSSATLRIYS
ncbi:hypothetical protein [Levilactobacillus brevis]|uniref:hypothetical protein n=1 Tax=Levilactobacillus brevis TaxID=1580 RepID=UPI00116445D0|nr:hypothetical protein [Levilactobacillus brevis]QCZ44463.1 hypothetical protein UCCLBBS124_2159 [Levilactobacillus brevis]